MLAYCAQKCHLCLLRGTKWVKYRQGELAFTPALFAPKHYAMQINVLAQESSDEVLRLCLLKKKKEKRKKTKEESCLRGRNPWKKKSTFWEAEPAAKRRRLSGNKGSGQRALSGLNPHNKLADVRTGGRTEFGFHWGLGLPAPTALLCSLVQIISNANKIK